MEIGALARTPSRILQRVDVVPAAEVGPVQAQGASSEAQEAHQEAQEAHQEAQEAHQEAQEVSSRGRRHLCRRHFRRRGHLWRHRSRIMRRRHTR